MKISSAGSQNYRSRIMPELINAINGNSQQASNSMVTDTLHLNEIENDYCRKWDLTLLLKKLYKVG